MLVAFFLAQRVLHVAAARGTELQSIAQDEGRGEGGEQGGDHTKPRDGTGGGCRRGALPHMMGGHTEEGRWSVDAVIAIAVGMSSCHPIGSLYLLPTWITHRRLRVLLRVWSGVLSGLQATLDTSGAAAAGGGSGDGAGRDVLLGRGLRLGSTVGAHEQRQQSRFTCQKALIM